MVQLDYPPQYQVDEFRSLGTLQMLIHIGNSTWRYRVWSVAWFPARALLVVVGRYGSKTP